MCEPWLPTAPATKLRISGILCDRAKTRPLAAGLVKHLTAIKDDRRGRGDGGETAP